MKALANDEDWRLVLVAAESLGRLGAKEALQALESISKSHWYPHVQNVALKSIQVLEGNGKLEPIPDRNHWLFPFYFFDYQNSFELETFTNAKSKIRPIPLLHGDPDEVEAALLQKLAYKAEIEELNGRLHKPKQVPSVGLKVEDGYIVGSDRGEWGGELVFIDQKGRQRTLLKKNVHGIYKMPFGILALTGLAHMFSNEGIACRIFKDTDGNWKAKQWKTLPGQPNRSGLTADAELFIKILTSEETAPVAVIISSDGKLRMAD
jgi:hypothetical protein